MERLLQNTVLVEFVLLLVIAGICGAVAQRLAGNKNAGCLGSIALGFIGAILGTVIARKADLPIIFSIPVSGKTFPIIWSIIGAALFSAVLALLSGSNRRQRPKD